MWFCAPSESVENYSRETDPQVLKTLARVIEGTPQVRNYEVGFSTAHKIVAVGQGEGVVLPALLFRRHHVHVAREDQTAVAVFRTGREADEVSGLAVALVAGGVEGNEAGENGLVGERLGGHRSPVMGSTMAVRAELDREVSGTKVSLCPSLLAIPQGPRHI